MLQQWTFFLETNKLVKKSHNKIPPPHLDLFLVVVVADLVVAVDLAVASSSVAAASSPVPCRALVGVGGAAAADETSRRRLVVAPGSGRRLAVVVARVGVAWR